MSILLNRYRLTPADTPASVAIADVTQSGGAGTTLTTGTISLTEGVPYFYQAAWNNAGTNGNATFYINGDTTAANYRSASVTATTSLENSDYSSGLLMGSTANNMAVAQGICGLQNSIPYIMHKQVGVSGSRRGKIGVSYSNTETTFTELQITTAANNLANDSYIKIWRLDQTPYAEVAVSGASVTTMTTGTFTALTEGLTYLFVMGLTCDTAAAYYRCRINGDTTGANYERGKITSSGVPVDTTDSATIGTLTAGSTMAMMWGYCGILDGVPYTNVMTVEASGAQRITQQSVYNTSETTFTELSLVSGTASNIADGSFIKIWEIG